MKVPIKPFSTDTRQILDLICLMSYSSFSVRALRLLERTVSFLTSNQFFLRHRRRLPPFRTWFPVGRLRTTRDHWRSTRMTFGSRCGSQRKCQKSQRHRRSSCRPSVMSCRRRRMRWSYRPRCRWELTETEQRLVFGLLDERPDWQSKQQPADPDASPAW